MSVVQLAWTIVLGVLGGLLAKAAFMSIETEWPEKYVFALAVPVRLQRRNLATLLLMKITPLTVVFFLVAATTEQLDGVSWISVVAAALVFGSLTDGWALIKTLRGRDSRRWLHVFYYLGQLTLLVVPGVLALGLARIVPFLAPTPRELIVALWTAAFVGVVTIALKSVAPESRQGVTEDLQWVEKDVGPAVWGDVESIAGDMGVEPALAQAIVVSEVLQRPRWFRRAERLFGRFRSSGTYGVAQMRSEKPVDDVESVRMLCASLPQSGDVPGSAAWERWEVYKCAVDERNSTGDQTQAVLALYDHLHDPTFFQSLWPADSHANGSLFPRLR